MCASVGAGRVVDQVTMPTVGILVLSDDVTLKVQLPLAPPAPAVGTTFPAVPPVAASTGPPASAPFAVLEQPAATRRAVPNANETRRRSMRPLRGPNIRPVSSNSGIRTATFWQRAPRPQLHLNDTKTSPGCCRCR